MKLSLVYYNLITYVLHTIRSITTLRRLLTNVKEKDTLEDRQGVVYKIKCCDCQATFCIGETSKNLSVMV